MVSNQSLVGFWIPCIAISSVANAAAPTSTEVTAAPAAESAWTVSTPFDWVNSVFTKTKEDYGITPSLSYTATVQGNPTGGVSRTVAYVHTLEFGLEFDLNQIAGLEGSSITISGVNAAGTNLSGASYINNAFPVSQAFVGHGTYLYELYWQQNLSVDDTVIRIGRINSSNFASLPAFGLQVNGGIDGNPDSLFINTAFESIPTAVWGADIKVNPSKEFSVYTGIFQATDFAGNQHGTDFSFRSRDRILWMGQVAWTPTFNQTTDANGKLTPGYSGTYIAGVYYSNLPMARFDGTGDVGSSAGIYLMGQQTVWYNKNNPNETIDVWGGFTYSPRGEIAQIDWMGFGGVVWNGIIPGRDQDQLLATMLVGTFSSEYSDSVVTPADGRPTYEMVLELSYVYNINSYAFIQPDIQYVIRPNGMKSTQDALVLGVQFGINF